MTVLKRVPFHNELFYIENVPTEEDDSVATKTPIEKTPSRLDKEKHLTRRKADWILEHK